MAEQHVGAQRVSSGEASIASADGNPCVGAGLPEADGASPAGIPAIEGNRVPRRGGAWPRRTPYARCEFQLSSKTVVGTRKASRKYNASLQRRKRSTRRRVSVTSSKYSNSRYKGSYR
jgi:hypothetical protein